MWTKKRLLVVGKTHPEYSKTHLETICTVAVDGDDGRLVRLYPLSMRYMERRPKEFEWISADVEKNPNDFRPESHRIRQDTVTFLEQVGTEDAWRARNELLLRRTNVFDSVETLHKANAVNNTSLGLVKPARFARIYTRWKSPQEKAIWDEKKAQALQQLELVGDDTEVRDLHFQWLEYRIQFECNDPECTGHDMEIRAWQLYELDRKMDLAKGSEEGREAVLAKLEEILDQTKREPYIFLGNWLQFPDTFMVGGIYSPPIRRQGTLFD